MGQIKEKLRSVLNNKKKSFEIENLKIVKDEKVTMENLKEINGLKWLAIIKENNEKYIVLGNPKSKALNEKDLKEYLESNGVKVGEIKVIK